MSDISIPYDEVCILALCDFLQKNVTIVTPKNVWSLYETDPEEESIFVVMVAKNNVYGTKKGKYYLYHESNIC